MVKEREAFSKTKIKGVSKNSNFGGKTLMHKSTSLLDFFKKGVAVPQVGVPLLLMVCCYAMLLCYSNVNSTANAMLVCYLGEMQTVSSYKVGLGWVELF